MSPNEIHTIPVPARWSPEQTWEAISRGDKLPDQVEITWTNVYVKDGKYVGLVERHTP